MRNTTPVAREGLFLHLDLGFPGSFHDVTIFHHFDLHMHWCVQFTHHDIYFK